MADCSAKEMKWYAISFSNVYSTELLLLQARQEIPMDEQQYTMGLQLLVLLQFCDNCLESIPVYPSKRLHLQVLKGSSDQKVYIAVMWNLCVWMLNNHFLKNQRLNDDLSQKGKLSYSPAHV